MSRLLPFSLFTRWLKLVESYVMRPSSVCLTFRNVETDMAVAVLPQVLTEERTPCLETREGKEIFFSTAWSTNDSWWSPSSMTLLARKLINSFPCTS